MNNNYRELTRREKQQFGKSVTLCCANYDREYGCLPLDCDCPMLRICYTNIATMQKISKCTVVHYTGAGNSVQSHGNRELQTV